MTAHKIASFVNLGAFVESEIAYEPFVPWQAEFLQLRAKTYAKVKCPLADKAAADLRNIFPPPASAPSPPPTSSRPSFGVRRLVAAFGLALECGDLSPLLA